MQTETEPGIFKNFLSSLSQNKKQKNLVIILGVLGILLLFISNFSPKQNAEKSSPEVTFSAEQYTKQLEKSLTEIVSSIQGAGRCKVLVTVENGIETVYATGGKKNTEATEDKSNGEVTKKQESDDSEVKYITIKESNGAEKALAITEIQPTVKGVVVVCSGGDDSAVQQRVINAVTTALNITSKRVCVTKLS